MKVRWREHEMIFVTILVVAQMILILFKLYNPAVEPGETDFAAGFRANGIPFIYWENILFPQLGSILLIYFCYLSINLLILPLVKKISFDDVEKFISVRTALMILTIAIVSYILALGVNVCTYYGKPHLFNYNGYQFLAFFGYNDKPLTNIFFGLPRALGFVISFTALFGIRELTIWFIARPGLKKEYRILIANNATALIAIYFLLLIIANPLHYDFLLYVAFITPAFFLYIYATFWLFPFKGENSFLHRPFLIRLLVSTFICTLPYLIVFARTGEARPLNLLLYWAFLLLIAIPFYWLLYQLRKDRIIQLRGMQTALATSDANLQFLRSQINPHFLFNALNTLYGTALKENAEHTAEGVQKLGDMMRFMLHENNLDFIPMDKEIEYLKNYITLQKLRTQSSPDIVIDDNIDEVKCGHVIAPMLLIPFVENAFKHGISLREKSWINILLECNDKTVSFEVRNSLHAHADINTSQDRSGIGLKNVMERLKLLYPNRHEISISNNSNEFKVKLAITC